MQNVLRMAQEQGRSFDPSAVSLDAAENVLDRCAPGVCVWGGGGGICACCMLAALRRSAPDGPRPDGGATHSDHPCTRPRPDGDAKQSDHPCIRPRPPCRWILAATRSLVAFVRQEMNAYRLYTVVPFLVKFLDDLTNVYVRLNRKRLKVGRAGRLGLFFIGGAVHHPDCGVGLAG